MAPHRHWLVDDAPPGIDAAADADLIVEKLAPRRLDPRHPLCELWSARTARARTELHQLADDLRSVPDVPGARALLKAMKQDRDGYADFRYELRMAANVARSPLQKLVRLGGQQQGPDIEFTSKSGHRCAIACYSARSAVPYIQHLRDTCQQIANRALPLFMGPSLRENLCLEVTFDDLPIRGNEVADAIWVIHPLLTNMLVPPRQRRGHVEVARVQVANDFLVEGDLRATRIRFLFAIRDHELKRIAKHLEQKVVVEAAAWAERYGGKAFLSVEESHGSLGALAAAVPALLESTPLSGAFVTSYPVEGLEHIEPCLRLELCGGVQVELSTFKKNIATWLGDQALASGFPRYAIEDWDLFQTRSGSGAYLVDSLYYRAHYQRVGQIPEGGASDPEFAGRLKEARAFIEAQNRQLPRAPNRTTRHPGWA